MSVQALSCAFALQGVSPSEKLVVLALANYADPQMRCFPSHSTLAKDTGLSERTVLTVLKSLEASRLLSRRQRRRDDGSRSTDIITLHFAGEVISPHGENDCEAKPQMTAVGGETASPQEPRTNLKIEEPSSSSGASKPDWNLRLKEAWQAAGAGLDQTAPEVHHSRDLRLLCEPQVGEPCEWEEVIIAIRLDADKAVKRRKPIRSWTWIHSRALDLRDRRLAGLRAPEPYATGPPSSFTDRIAAENAEARRRVLSDGK